MIKRLDVKIVLALVVTVLVPLGFSVYLVAKVTDASLGLGLNNELADQFEKALEVQREHIEALKSGVRLRFAHIADSHRLISAAASSDGDEILKILNELIEEDPSLRMIRLVGPEGRSVEVRAKEDLVSQEIRTLPLQREVSLGPFTTIEAVFGVNASILESYERAGKEFATYRALVQAPPAYLNNRFVWVYLFILGATVMLSISIGVLWSRRLAQRIHMLSQATTLVAEGDLSVRVESGSTDEVGQLVESFNGMVAELAVSRARIEYLQKISAWQEMARRLAHEIKNPLTPIQLAVQQVKEKYDGDDEKFKRLLDQSTEIIKEEVATLRRLTSDFSSFAKLPEVKPEPVDLGGFLEDCEASLAPVAQQEGVALDFDTQSKRMNLQIDRIMMKRVIDNLVRNASEALTESRAENPRITVTAMTRKVKKKSEVEIRVTDNGPGVPTEKQPAIFDPYFTTKSEGTGLGLAIVKKIVLEHGGRIWLDEQVAGGASFVISLPVAADAPQGQSR